MKSRLTDEFINKFCSYLEDGLTRKDACILCDLDESTIYKWFKQADIDEKSDIDSKFVKFSKAVKKAETKDIEWHVKNIRDKAQVSWQASAWWLERRRRKEYGSNIVDNSEPEADKIKKLVEDEILKATEFNEDKELK